VGIFDIVGNFLAGLVRMPLKTFLIFDILGNVVIFSTVLSLGYVAGNYWQNFTSSLSTVSWILFVAILIGVIVKIFYSRKKSS
jgi:membrane protein DedA with SNARE-associated domain